MNTQEAPARAVTVELVNATNRTVLATVATDASGNYTLTAPPNTGAFVRAKALSVSTGSGAASWDNQRRSFGTSSSTRSTAPAVTTTAWSGVSRGL